jgi:cation transport regulator ChaC
MGMGRAFVFGYGSLLMAGVGRPCRLLGHRRSWGVAMDNRRTLPGYKYYLRPDGSRPELFVAFLDLVREPGAAVDGVLFEVPDLGAVDARERNYARVEVTGALDGGPGGLAGPVWAYLGLAEARERYARARAAGSAVVARAYLEGVRAGLAAHGLAFETAPELPVVDLDRVDVPLTDAVHRHR